jgi:phage/plasmid-associated DNA primase
MMSNSNPSIIGCANGTLVLGPSITLRPTLPEDEITFQTGIPYEVYNPSEPTPKHLEVLAFLKRIHPNLYEYILTLYSSCLEGINREHGFYIKIGAGSNGKSAIDHLNNITFGDYATALTSPILSEESSEELIKLRGKRYIYTGEPDIGETITFSNIKQLCGEDPITIPSESIRIMGKIFMSCNTLPKIDGGDELMWEHIRVIPYTSQFVEPGHASIDPAHHIYERDISLYEKMKDWRVAYFGILVWYFQNHYLVHGLTAPACVLEATQHYKDAHSSSLD